MSHGGTTIITIAKRMWAIATESIRHPLTTSTLVVRQQPSDMGISVDVLSPKEQSAQRDPDSKEHEEQEDTP
jgi:hypothetical protein